MEYVNKLDKILHQDNVVGQACKTFEEKTGVKRIYFALGLIAFVAIYLMFGYGSQFLANFIGFLYPAYASVKAIETHDKEDDTKWLTYWVVYAGFSLVETFADIFLWWIPLYAFIKCIFLIYLMLPIQANGSVMLYNRVIRPFILKYQKSIDDTLDKVHGAAGQLVHDAPPMPLDRYRNSALVDGVNLHELPLAEGSGQGLDTAANQKLPTANVQQLLPNVFFRRRLVSGATGSAYLEFGDTKVLCSVHGLMEPKRSTLTDSAAAEQSKAQLLAFYKLAPFARQGRVPYQPDEAERRAAAFLQDTLSPCLRLDRLPKSRLELHCLVLEDAGGCLAAAVTCGGLALVDAGLELYDLVTAATVARPLGQVGGAWSAELASGAVSSSSSSSSSSSVTLAYMRNLRQLAGLWVDAAEPLEPAEVDAACMMCVEPCKVMHATVRQFLMADAGLLAHADTSADGGVGPMEH